jgi:hypothetical protein
MSALNIPTLLFLALTSGIAAWSLVRSVRYGLHHGVTGCDARCLSYAISGTLILLLDVVSAIYWAAVAPV